MDAIVQLRPQFSHLDAITEARGEARRLQTRSERPDNRDNVEPEPEARAVNMAVKSTEGNEEDMYGGMRVTAKLLRDMRDEPWQRLAWVDQDVSYLNNHAVGNKPTFYRNRNHTASTTMPWYTKTLTTPLS